jgi:hypothetical protein
MLRRMAESTMLRRSIDQWLVSAGIRPKVVAELEDTALLKVFGQDGVGIFPGPTAIEGAIQDQYSERLSRVFDFDATAPALVASLGSLNRRGCRRFIEPRRVRSQKVPCVNQRVQRGCLMGRPLRGA